MSGPHFKTPLVTVPHQRRPDADTDADAGMGRPLTSAVTDPAQDVPEAGQFGPPRGPPDIPELWFDKAVDVQGPFRDLLETYSGVPPEEVDGHVLKLRNRAWEVHPYPCIGQFRFLELNLAHRGDLYARLLGVLKSTPSSGQDGDGPLPLFLDVGCCLGQDVRKLIHDGAPVWTVAGADLSGAFIELGYHLFRDTDRLPSRQMVAANILEPINEESPLAPFRGRLSVVQLGMLLHLFTWEEQVLAFENAARMLRDERGTMIIGQASGNLEGVEEKGSLGKGTFKHNAGTFKKLIKAVQDRTGTKWEVTVGLDTGLSIFDGKRTWDNLKTRRLLFEIERI